MPKAKPYSGTVDDKVAAQLLNSTGVTVDAVPLGDALREAASRLLELVEHANGALEESAFAPIVAEHLANKLGRRGHATLSVSDSGSVLLDITYEEQPKRQAKPRRSSTVPLMDDLKKRAEELGVDITEFGIKRKKIHGYLEKVASGEIKPEKKAEPDPDKTSPKKPTSAPKPKEIQTANGPPEVDPGPMSAGPDETRVTPPPDEPKPPKKGFVKTSQAISSPVVVDMHPVTPKEPEDAGTPPKSSKSQEKPGKGPSMRDLVQEASGVDIADLLASEPPK